MEDKIQQRTFPAEDISAEVLEFPQSDIVEVIIMANPSRSMGNYKRFCTDKAEAVDKFLNDVKDRPLTPHEVIKLKKLRDDLENQFGRAHAKWEDLVAADEFPDDTVYAKCE